ncbi:outer membrane beta-barrel protein [Flavisolibacter nicotianae]|uniref:outer membrane beta-barrel protein n=1 Tax=Flavisolibacter nicotianae TaxID=2364882 RepID=UPI0013C4BBE0|nr:outer membrane beta-barrel protein [Flavisolibacter nicotianae]
MRKVIFSVLILCFGFAAVAQTDTSRNARLLSPMQIPSSDHFMIQIGSAAWQNKPDSIQTKGFSRTFNMYLMLDFPFKTNPHFSVALGPGLSTDHIFLDNRTAAITSTATKLTFPNVADTNHFKKYKVSTAFLEVPVELRYSTKPESNGSSVKLAIGAKVGTLLAAWTKGKTLQNKTGSTINDFIEKEKDKRYFNSTRLSLTGRIGYGHFSAFASYALTPVFKEGVAPKVNTLSLGLTVSGL